MAERSRPIFPVILVLFGILGIFNASKLAPASGLRDVEVVQLVGSGMCFGIALVWLVARLRGKPLE
jgi:hypothetical protein